MNYESSMDFYKNLVESGLSNYLLSNSDVEKGLLDSMEYSLLSGGKRIRPVLMMAFYELFGGNANDVVPFACAIEMIHTYSLIHDDLPCMDSADFRRGKPSNHIVYGESISLLAGDALLTNAFNIMTSNKVIRLFNPEKILKVIKIISNAVGASGMISGQVIDLSLDRSSNTLNSIIDMYMKKTGLLIESSIQAGSILANANEEQLNLAKEYGKIIGLEFQLVDDLLDVQGEDDVIGKPSGSDDRNNKCTYISLNGLKNTKIKIKELTCEAIDILNEIGKGTEFLKELTLSLECRVS